MEPAARLPLSQADVGRRRLRREARHLVRTALKLPLQTVKRPDDLHVFKVLPRRWVVERTLAWITRHRRTGRDYERLEAAEPAEHAASSTQHASSSPKRLLIAGVLGPAGINPRPGRPGVCRQHPEVLLFFPLWHLGVFPLFPGL